MQLSPVVCQPWFCLLHCCRSAGQECWAGRWAGCGELHADSTSCPAPLVLFILFIVEAATGQLGRSLPLSGCLVCPGLEAIVIGSVGGGVSGKCFSHLFSSAFYLGCVFFFKIKNKKMEYYHSAAMIPQQTRRVYRQFQRPTGRARSISSPELDFCNLWLYL